MRIGLLIGGAIGALAAMFAALTGDAKAAPKLPQTSGGSGGPVPPPNGDKPGAGTSSLPAGTLPGSAPAGQAAGSRPLLSQAKGSRGPDVVEWQKILGIPADGIFGSSTDRITRQWQKAHGLIVDGIVGPRCWDAAHAAGIAPAGGVNSGAVSVSASGAVDDGFDALLAKALAAHDVPALTALMKQAEARGLYASARSIAQEIALLTGTAPAYVPPLVDHPTTAPTDKPTGRAILSYAAGSRGADVLEWQRIIGTKNPDGIFGQNTDTLTKAWQKAHGLTADGIVGPKSWEVAYSVKPALAVEPRPPVLVVAQPNKPPAVVITSPGIMPNGGTVIPASYDPAINPATVVPASSMPAESDGRMAAIELTDYLTANGGLAFRWKEDFKRMAAWMARLGVPDPKGRYGRDTARAIMQRGLVPVTPFYWPATGAQAAKRDFLAMVKTYADSDPQRAAQWSKLVSDVNRA